MTETPQLFSAHNLRLQVAWDATSLGATMFCPRFYQYSILEGWASPSIDLQFGILVHQGAEIYNKALLRGSTWEEAQAEAVEGVFNASHDFGGEFIDMWRCKGETLKGFPYRNAKGNVAKCPYSHKGKWFEAPGPALCGACGSETETVNRYFPYHKQKHRANLLRAVTWGAEEERDGPFRPIADPVTQEPLVEIHFITKLEQVNRYGENYWLCGYLDAVKSYEDEHYITDKKSTKNWLGDAYYSQFAPNIQVNTYDYVGARHLFPSLEIKGILIEAIQLTLDGARFGKHMIKRSEVLRKEYLYDTMYWIKQAEEQATHGYWPKNERNCYMCAFKEVCSSEPQHRQAILEGRFTKRVWDPTKER